MIQKSNKFNPDNQPNQEAEEEDDEGTRGEKIEQGKSSHDIAMTYDVHPSTIRRKAKELGLKFETQSCWRKK